VLRVRERSMVWMHGVLLALSLAGPAFEEENDRKFLVLDLAGMASPQVRQEVSAQVRGGASDALRGMPWLVMSNDLLRPMLMALGEDERLCETGRCSAEHLRKFGADAGILGEVMVVEKTTYVTLNLHDVRMGTRVDSATLQADSVGELYPQVRKTAALLIRRGLQLEDPAKAAAAGEGQVRKSPPSKPASSPLLLMTAERGHGETEFNFKQSLTQRMVVDALKEGGFQVLTDPSWIPAPSVKHVKETGDLPLLDAQGAAKARNASRIVAVRVVMTSLETRPDKTRLWMASVRVKVYGTQKLDQIYSKELQQMMECNGESLDDCAQTYRVKVLEEVLPDLPLDDAPKAR